MVIEEYDVHNLDCPDCGAKIEAEINNLEEVESANLDFINKRLTIEYIEKVDNPLKRLNAIASKIDPDIQFTLAGWEEGQSENKPWFIILAILLLTFSLFLSAPFSSILGIIAYLIAGHKVIKKALKEIASRQIFTENFLMTLATLGALYLGELIEASAVMILYEIGLYGESRAIAKSRKNLQSLLMLKPEKAHLKTESGIEDQKLNTIQKDQIILVYAGERIPLDGVVIKGESTVDTSSLTGEAIPVFVEPKSTVFAGFLNGGGILEIQAQNTEAESMVSRIIKLIENASSKKSDTEKFMTRFARYYTPAVVLAAVLVFVIPVILGYNYTIWLQRALIFLVVSCPCALVISIPLTYYIGIGKSAKTGIIFKGSIYLDLLNRVKTLIFDKTGTLTTGELRIAETKTAPDIDQDELQLSTWLCEWTSSHPFAKAIKKAFSYKFEPSKVDAFSEFPGKGILLVYNKDRYLCGSEIFLQSFGFINLLDAGDYSVVHTVKNDIYLGCISFVDELKPGMKEVVKTLKQMGIKHLSVLSGDRIPKVEKVAKELDLDSFYASLTPESKLTKLEEIINSSKDKVAYCGDGLNDAPVLARADVGIAMGKIGAQASIETADVVLLNDKPEQLKSAFSISKQTNKIVWQNIFLALSIKMLVMILGVAGLAQLWEAVIADVGVTLLVIFNSLRIMKHPEG
ncbi:MAG TPA: heavy metal translocating P-type ATPase [Candidatus Cloacimonas sp.]|nr:heavy metal translocating P-type ATPase [Candidatus Cloacimonas sp.]HNS84099.1 heavy metal translocating P-type ATPase [Candidatus Cloacimonas sp.]HPH93339.1 heavy metal translocating P-type ATPase [Candidatus Cloacimonas sp.]HPX10326.1 heavy metal translocating P-type ATPase [Candidatus Cloacimonas sp.]HQM03084.1 heavy metal translocating P-type ATPase [Candidatus Cloacimonas sp.]